MTEPRFPSIPGYEFIKLLGFACGGRVVCSSLFLARHSHSNVLVWMTVSNQRGRDHFPGRLPASAVSLEHPNILRVIGVGEHEGYSYEAVEAVEESKSLSALLQERPLATTQVRTFLLSLISALQCAAARGMFHRNLKPASIVISEANMLKLHPVDFCHPSGSHHHPLLGTPTYMPPEVVRGESAAATAPAAQVYGVGAVMYETLTRQPPFVGHSAVHVLEEVLRARPVLPSQHDPTIPADLEKVCMRCLEKQPQLRFRTLQQLADAIVAPGDQADARGTAT